MQHPKFEEKVNQAIVKPAMEQASKATYGIILDYNQFKNTASVLVSHPGSDAPGEAFYNVPCPVHLGVQGQAPLPGRPCWVAFKDTTNWFPIVVAFFNHIYEDVDFDKQTIAKNNIPRYMITM